MSFEKLMMVGSGGGGDGDGDGDGGEVKVKGGGITDWKDIPMELLLQIVSLVADDQTVIIASGVCRGWRDSICRGVTHLSLSWY